MDERDKRQVLFPNEAYQIQGAAFAVYREMGSGYLEAVYQECLALEFSARRVPFQPKPCLTLFYKGVKLQQTYVPDFVCFGSVIVELKAVREVAPEHRAQLINYLRATGLRLGLLINFPPNAKAQVERLVL